MEPSKFCLKGDTIAILEHGQNHGRFDDPAPGNFKIDFARPASKLTLVDFPPADYQLFLNGNLALESKQNVFDLSELKGSQMIDGMLNFGRVDIANIRSPIDLRTCDGILRFTTKDGDVDVKFMFWSYFLVFNHPTASFDLEFKNDSKDKGNCKIFLNGDLTWDFDVPTDESVIRVKCRNPKQLFHGTANRYLTETINKNSINFSWVDHIRVSTTKCRLIECSSLAYIIYRKPSMRKVIA